MNFTGASTINGVAPLDGTSESKSKTTRRVNTAERRATHNAVERQRRETLNGRFMDLAGMLSNLRTIRRPSKSAIVNSSIAHLRAARRHRGLAAHELRVLSEENDALRVELNAWRARNGLGGVEEPVRGEGWELVMSGELAFEAGEMMDGEEGEEEDARAADDYREYCNRQEQEREQAERRAAEEQAHMHMSAHAGHRPHHHPSAAQDDAIAIAGPVLPAFDNPAHALSTGVPYEYEHFSYGTAFDAKWQHPQQYYPYHLDFDGRRDTKLDIW
ncbi:hypothetical protein C8R47DRAFT_1067713 [Mycena vitilis]|nr:hypothetical protein C8R47DRAFT_1067713 [Mycena vitilis]